MSFVNKDWYDVFLNTLKTNCTHIVLLPSEIQSYSDVSANELGRVAAPTFTLADGSVSGSRKLEFDDVKVTVTKDGTLSHIGFLDETNDKLYGVTELFLPKNVVQGETANLEKNAIEIGG